jgi:hypothetical protein
LFSSENVTIVFFLFFKPTLDKISFPNLSFQNASRKTKIYDIHKPYLKTLLAC